MLFFGKKKTQTKKATATATGSGSADQAQQTTQKPLYYTITFEGITRAATYDDLLSIALKVAHNKNDFISFDKVSEKVAEGGYKWSSHAWEKLSKMDAQQLIDYINGREV